MTAENSVYKSFAQNLYALSIRSGSIAETCRQLRINRQQFNKYLAGTRLPSSTTLLKISNHFGVDQRSLFEPPNSASHTGSHTEPPVQSMPQQTTLETRVWAKLEGTQCASIPEGCYNLYFPGAKDATKIFRSALFIRNVEGRTIFTCLSFGRPQTAKLKKAQMRHEGLAFEIDNLIYLVAQNKTAHREISLLSFGKIDLPISRTFGGLALTLAPWGGPICTRVSAEYIGPWSARRKVMKAIGEVSVDSPDVSEELRKSLTTPLKSSEAILGPYDFFSHMRRRFL